MVVKWEVEVEAEAEVESGRKGVKRALRVVVPCCALLVGWVRQFSCNDIDKAVLL